MHYLESMCSAKQLYCVTATHVEKMATNCTVSATLADPETLEEITLNDKEFFGAASDEEESVSHATAKESEDKYLSPNEDEEAMEHTTRGLALPEGPQPSTASSQDDEMSDI